MNWAPARSKPRSMVLAMGPTVLPQPNGSSIRLRMRWLKSIAGMPRCAAVDGRTLGLCRHMRRHIHGAQLVDEVFGIVALVSAQGDADRPVRARLDHGQRRVPFGMAVRMSEAGFDHKAVAVFHQGMAHVAKLRFLALALAVKAGIGIGDGSVGLVGAFLPVEVHFGPRRLSALRGSLNYVQS